MQAITVKYLAPTNRRGARVKASADTGRTITIPWDYDLGEGSYAKVARTFAIAHGWIGPNDPIGQTFHQIFAEGSTPTGKVYVFRKDGHQ